MIDGVTYFQVVFTLPDKLSSLMLGNRKVLYRTLMHAAWEALRTSVETELGIRAAALMVLHTWNQRLEHHPHVHVLVPGSGPSLDGSRWIAGKTTKATRSKPARPFLVDNRRLGQAFRRQFVQKLDRLRRRNELDFGGTCESLRTETGWTEFKSAISEFDWCAFIEPPPDKGSSPQHVLKYLARYLTGGPISDRRLIDMDESRVTFLARNPNKSSPQGQIPISLTGIEFTRRWSLHILPKHFTKTRYFGGYSSNQRTEFIETCRRFVPKNRDVQPDDLADATSESDSRRSNSDESDSSERELRDEDASPKCRSCGGPMDLVLRSHRPAWREVFYGPDHPAWFES